MKKSVKFPLNSVSAIMQSRWPLNLVEFVIDGLPQLSFDFEFIWGGN